ncbi:PREDICTED: uncharacterized protein LOC108558063 [Nicrophorus vespilloides]|uniref:Uncharacterized protein LOC108558063 n=1 Tax=Nicrophorus vespilloides TaxID=110193 RepID=A0ABM1M709_NICVS|nr:PREDICTED: uncharacterized protein LOC108558063 [Nicrophorus vespilloides]
MELLVRLLCVVAIAGAITVETKLDFQDEPKVIKKLGKDVGGCSTTGCNTTKKIEASDTISADVIVEVKTNLDVAKQNTDDDEVPDVPIVLGYAGTDLEDKKVQDNVINPNPIVVSSFDQSFPDVKNGGGGFIPLPALNKPYYNSYVPRNTFNSIPRPDWRMSPSWYLRPPQPTSTWTTCTCHPTVSWQPSTAPSYRYNPGLNNPGLNNPSLNNPRFNNPGLKPPPAQIDGKLAPLN